MHFSSFGLLLITPALVLAWGGDALPSCGLQLLLLCWLLLLSYPLPPLSISLSLSIFLTCLKWAEVSRGETGPLQRSSAEDKITLPTVKAQTFPAVLLFVHIVQTTHTKTLHKEHTVSLVYCLMWSKETRRRRTECTLMAMCSAASVLRCSSVQNLLFCDLQHLYSISVICRYVSEGHSAETES